MISVRGRLAAVITVLAVLLVGLLPAASGVRAAESAILPGAVDRTSVELTATYDVRLRLSYGAGTLAATSTMTVTNTSGGPIDRLELNTVAARLGRLRISSVSVDGRPVTAAVRDQTVLVPLGGILPEGATASVRIAFTATVQRTTGGSSWLLARANGVLQLYRWLPWISRERRSAGPTTATRS